MEVRPRNKQTELAEVPLDWQIFRLADHFEIYAGGDVPKDLVSDVQSEKFPYPIYANALQRRGLYGYTNERRSKPDSITITARGYLGHAEYREEPFFPIVRLLVLEPRGSLDAKFSSYVINNRIVFPVESTGVPQLTAPQVSKYSLVAPTDINEQRAIAAALSDVDALIAGLEKLIAKKRDLKQAAMQQLLTGQTRLPGFSGEWVDKALGDVANIKTGSRNNEDKVEDGFYPFFVRSAHVERINSYSHECEAILVPGEGQIGEIFHYINGRFDVHQRVYAITQFVEGVNGKYIHLYMSQHFGAWAMQNTVKATVDSLRLPTFQTFQVQLPPTVEEQAAIAQMLSDLDAELLVIGLRLSKTRELKQGMMQELLTGRTRLIKANENE